MFYYFKIFDYHHRDTIKTNENTLKNEMFCLNTTAIGDWMDPELQKFIQFKSK